MDYASIRTQEQTLWEMPFELRKERVTLYAKPNEVVINSPSNYNSYYGQNDPNLDVQYVTNSGEFWATIEYIDQRDNQQITFNPNDNPAVTSVSRVRLTLETGALIYFNGNSEKVIIDGRNFKQESAPQLRGPYVRSQMNVWLLPIE